MKNDYNISVAYANKFVRQLKEKLNHIYGQEDSKSTYVEISGEKPIIPDYDLKETRRHVADLMEDITTLKHAINQFNTTAELSGTDLTVDQALVRMAMLNQEKSRMLSMMQTQPKTVHNSYRNTSSVAQYDVANFNPEDAAKYYEQLESEITSIQLKQDSLNAKYCIKVELHV